MPWLCRKLDPPISCVLCYEPDFDKEGFSERTVLICDTCEREFHVGCLRNAGVADLTVSGNGERGRLEGLEGEALSPAVGIPPSRCHMAIACNP